MKALFTYILFIFMLISCEPVDMIYFKKKYVEVDYQAQEVILTTDADITTSAGRVFSETTDTDPETKDEYIVNENYFITKGDWFTITVDRSQPRRVSVLLQENETDKDRKVVVYVHRFAGGDHATIVQKAKATDSRN